MGDDESRVWFRRCMGENNSTLKFLAQTAASFIGKGFWGANFDQSYNNNNTKYVANQTSTSFQLKQLLPKRVSVLKRKKMGDRYNTECHLF